MQADYFIAKLNLQPHQEGGYFREVYRSESLLPHPDGATHDERRRNLSTTILYLLRSGQTSRFHKLTSDEIWFYHYGCSVVIHLIEMTGELTSIRLGLDLERGESPQAVIPKNTIFGAEILVQNSFSLVSCMVAPGFDYRDFTLFDPDTLCAMFPHHMELIQRISAGH